MRITFVYPMPALLPGGGARVVQEYANYLARNGHTVNVIFPCPSNIDSESKSIRMRATQSGDWWKARTSATVRRLIGKSALPWMPVDSRINFFFVATLDPRFLPDADVVFATFWRTVELVAELPASKGKKFYLIQGYETWAGPKERVDRAWRAPFHKVVVSRWLYEVGRALGATQMRHVSNAIDHEQFKITQPNKARDLAVLTMHQQASWKGADDAMTIFTWLHERYPDLRLSMFGLDRRSPRIPAWIGYSRNPGCEELRDLYNNHSIYLGTSREEGWGLPPAEAMACGCAFVGTDIGGFREFAINQRTALLSPPGDCDAMFRNLCDIIEHPELRSRLQKAGTDNIRQFKWERSGAMLEDYLREIVARDHWEAGAAAQ